MLFTNSVDRQVNHLRRDAARVAQDLGRLSQHIARNGREGAIESHREMMSKAKENFGLMGERFSGARDGLQFVHNRIRATPIRYACGALCAGIALGALIPRNERRRRR